MKKDWLLKQLGALSLIGVMSIGLVACGSGGSNAPAESATEEKKEETTEETAESTEEAESGEGQVA
ncbi:MAG: hypothetical protein QM697_14395, partial [Lachnospiraceae bacterium]